MSVLQLVVSTRDLQSQRHLLTVNLQQGAVNPPPFPLGDLGAATRFMVPDGGAALAARFHLVSVSALSDTKHLQLHHCDF